MKSPYEYLADLIVNRPRLMAGVIIVGLVLALVGASMVYMKTGNETYVYKDTPDGSLILHYSDEFASDSIIIIIEGEDLLAPDVVKYVASLEKDLINERYVTGATSYVDVLTAANNGVIPQSQGEIEAARAKGSEYLKSLLPSDTMALMSVPLDTGLSSDTEIAIVNNIRGLVKLAGSPAGITVSISGNPAFSADMMDDMSTNMSTLISLAMILMVVAVVFLFGHVRYRILPVFVVFCGILNTFGFMGIAGIGISSVVIAAFPVLIGIGIDYAIQMHARIDEESRRSPLPQAVHTAITGSGPAIFLAMIATGLGFVALAILAPAPSVADFGYICIVGIIWCYLSALLIVPTFAMVINYKPLHETHPESPGSDTGKLTFMEKYDCLLGKFSAKVARKAVLVLLVLSMIGAIGYILDEKVVIDTDEDSMVSTNMPAYITMSKVSSVIGSTSTITAYIKADSLKDPDTLKWIYDFGEYTVEKNNNQLTGVTSIATLLKTYNGGVLPRSIGEIETAWEKIPESTLSRYLSGQTESVMQFSMKDISIPTAQSLVEVMEKDLAWYVQHPGMSVTYTGTIPMFTGMINSISDTKNPMTILGFALIFIFLLIVYRSFTGVTPVVPLILIVGWNGFAMYALGLTYSLLTATLGAMTIGVASEYTILIMERYHEEKAKGVDMIEAIQTAIQKIGTAISVSGLTTVFGFAALLLATSPMIQNFGAITVLTVVFSLIGAIVVMPAIIVVMESAIELWHKKIAGIKGSYL